MCVAVVAALFLLWKLKVLLLLFLCFCLPNSLNAESCHSYRYAECHICIVMSCVVILGPWGPIKQIFLIWQVSVALEQMLETMSSSYGSLSASASIEDHLVYPLAASVAHLVRTIT